MTINTDQSNNEQALIAIRLHELHAGPPLILANVWDGASAVICQNSGAKAVATTSAGIAWSQGRSDGEGLSRSEAMTALARITSVAKVPVTADIERGYGETLSELAQTIREVVRSGAVGINIEDGSPDGSIREPAEQAERIFTISETARDLGIDLFINARLDSVLFGLDDGSSPALAELSRRYVEAGAHGIFVPGIGDLKTIRSLSNELGVPLNVMIGAAGPTVAEVIDAGARRISVGMAIAQRSYALVGEATTDLLDYGSTKVLAGGIDYAELNCLFV